MITTLADDEAERKKKKKTRPVGDEERLASGSHLNFGFENGQKIKKNSAVAKIISKVQHNGSYTQKERAFRDSKEVSMDANPHVLANFTLIWTLCPVI